MQTLATILKQRLENAARVGLLGIGSQLRADDVAGILVAQRVKQITAKKIHPKLKTFVGGTAPENLTGEIKKFLPTHLIIVDSADLGSKPGKIVVMNPDDIGGASFCTHSLPINVMTDYLLKSFDCHIVVIGIQPKSLIVGAPPSKEVLKAIDSLSTTISKLFHKLES